MVAAHVLSVDVAGEETVQQRSRTDEVVKAPALVFSSGARSQVPVGVLGGSRIQMSKRIHKSLLLEEPTKRRFLFRCESSIFLLCFRRTVNVNILVGYVQVSTPDDRLTCRRLEVLEVLLQVPVPLFRAVLQSVQSLNP
jgi:hypothetical protein